MKKTDLEKQLKKLNIGDLISVEWTDASVGNSIGHGTSVDVPVFSWGIFMGIFGERMKHVVIAQNSFRFMDGRFDVDRTAIPLSWALKISVVVERLVPKKVAGQMVQSFMLAKRTGALSMRRRYMERVSAHGL